MGVRMATDLCNEIYNTVYIVDIYDVPTDRTRTITPHESCHQLLRRIIMDKNKGVIEREIGETQSGFRPGIGIREGIFNIRTIHEKLYYLLHKLYEKALDRGFHGDKLLSVIHYIEMDGER